VIVVGLGGNVGGEVAIRERFVRARAALAEFGELGAVRSSSLFRSAPLGPAQPDYLNAAVGVAWRDAQPGEVLATILELERLLGRDRRGEPRWGPRTIDLDVLWWSGRTVRQPDFEVPHPRLWERRFALAPLAELVADPAITAALARVGDQRVELVATTW
jgi:2-amino-4-hydroxy-6-hydroxymethyldihydropteridine diphosphokinase